jgi:manganese/zinc/iron transport system permease protein
MECAVLIDLSTHYTFWIALCGTTLFGFVAGLLGFLIVMRGHSLMTDVVCHATLPGAVIPYLFITSMNQFVCMLGGLVTGALSVCMVHYIERVTKLKIDAALGVVVSFFFGSGLVLVTYVQKKGYAQQGFLNKLFLGNAALFSFHDFQILFLIVICVSLVIWIYRYRFHLMLFDREGFHVFGFSLVGYDALLMTLLIVVATVGLPIMGSIVMSAALIAPAVVVKQSANSFFHGLVYSGLYGAAAGFLGVAISSYIAHLPTGPIVALILTGGVFLFSLAKKGLSWSARSRGSQVCR